MSAASSGLLMKTGIVLKGFSISLKVRSLSCCALVGFIKMRLSRITRNNLATECVK